MTVTGGLGTFRTYTVDTIDGTLVVDALAERSPSTIAGDTSVCIKLPADASFHAVVLGRINLSMGNESLPTPANAVTPQYSYPSPDYGTWPTPAGAWCRLVFVAPDGSHYGSAIDSPDVGRWIMGYYPKIEYGGTPDTGIPSYTTIGQDSTRQHHLMMSQPPLLYGANVVLTARRLDPRAELQAYETRNSWHIVPGAVPPANVVVARAGTDGAGITYAEFNTAESETAAPSNNGISVMVVDSSGIWRYAIADSFSGATVTAKTDRQIYGILIGSNGAPSGTTLKQRFIVTEGRFWINPNTSSVVAGNNRLYYLTTASGYATVSPYPSAIGPRRPLFVHHSEGWCTMLPQNSGPSQFFCYDDSYPSTPRVALIDETGETGTDGLGRISYRDCAIASHDTTAKGAETDEVYAWFLTTDYANRAVVMKRGDFVLNIDTIGNGSNPSTANRGGRIRIPYKTAERVTTAYPVPVGSGGSGGVTGWFTIQPYVDRLVYKDSDVEVMAWYGNPTTPQIYSNSRTTGRRMSFSCDVEVRAGWNWYWMDQANTDRIKITQADFTALTAFPASSAGGFLKIREIQVCDSTNPLITKKIAILASAEY
jgi:hypothetical protein